MIQKKTFHKWQPVEFKDGQYYCQHTILKLSILKVLTVANSLSRMILATANEATTDNGCDNNYTYLNYVTDDIPSLNCQEISNETAKDPILKLVKHYIVND